MRILFVGMANSIHIARWINQLNGLGWDIHLFPVESVENVGIDGELREATVHQVLDGKRDGWHPSIRAEDDFWPFLGRSWPLPRGSWRARRFLQRRIPAWKKLGWHLAQTIRKLQPDIIHSIEFQHGAYLVLEARRYLDRKLPAWIVTNWGHDIYLFSRLKEHVEKVKAVLSACDYYVCECQRDVGLARALGFKGEILPLLPGAGGFDIERLRQLRQHGPTSARRVIVLKGSQSWYGRALVGLRGIALCADLLKDYRTVIYSALPEVKIAAELLAGSTGIPIEIFPPCSNEEMLRLHGKARVSIGVAISDAISISLLEAMIMGSFPIQSNTSCADEWIRCGETGILVHPEDPDAVANALRRALLDDTLVDQAAEINA
jgi:glycosyltransferase involved in cell wall biosynthesis